MRDDRGVSIAAGKINGVERFTHRADLVDLDQDCVGNALVDTLLQELYVCDKQVVPNQLNLATDFFRKIRPAFPIIFGQAIFQRNNRIIIRPLRPEAHHVIGTLR